MDIMQDMLPQMTMKVSPRLVAANHILELSSMELQETIAEELRDNPALELIERPTCPVCGNPLQGNICLQCRSRERNEQSSVHAWDYGEEYSGSSSGPASSEEEFDPLTQVAAQMTLSEQLLMDLQAILPPVDLPIAEYLVGNLDDSGYLRCTVAEAAHYLSVEERRVEFVLTNLQAMEPVGIGARDLRECLLLQLSFLEEEGAVPPHARTIITRFLTELGEHKFSRIAAALSISIDEVSAVWEFIKRELNPYPAQGANVGNSQQPMTPQTTFVLPDVVIGETEKGYEIEVVESKRFFLRLNPIYHQLSSELEMRPDQFNDDERRHIQQYVSRAKLFISNINQRRQTLYRITSCLIACQGEFLKYGVRHLRALTRAQVAAELGIHESTVSRATAGKFIMLPTKEVIPFSNFFTASLSVKDVIKEIIAQENAPLTDQQIAERLNKRGIKVARRTVAKYREQLGILPSFLR